MSTTGLPAFPTPWTVSLERYSAGVEDPYGNVTPGWSDPEEIAVYGWAPPSAGSEPWEAARNTVTWDLDVYAPPGTTVHPNDRMTVDGLTYDVIAYAEDFTHGPFGWAPGVRINLKRVEG